MTLGISEDHLALHDTTRRWVETHCPPRFHAPPRRRRDNSAVLGRAAIRRLAGPPRRRGAWGRGLRAARVGGRAGGAGAGSCPRTVPVNGPHVGADPRGGGRLPTGGAPAEAGVGRDPCRGRLHRWCGRCGVGRRHARPRRLRGPRARCGAGRHPPRAGCSRRGRDVVRGRPVRRRCHPPPQPGSHPPGRGGRDLRARRAPLATGSFPPTPTGDRPGHGVARRRVGRRGRLVRRRRASYAKVREQFGRPIGQFQAVKHRCADMLCAPEQARAVAWDAFGAGTPTSSSSPPRCAGPSCPRRSPAAPRTACRSTGGIGFTWEHDAHLYLKRALAVRQLLGGPSAWRSRVASLAAGGARRTLTLDLPAEADEHRATVSSFLDDLKQQDRADWPRLIAEAGYIVPHWPAPWGRDAGPVEQLVIDEEFRAGASADRICRSAPGSSPRSSPTAPTSSRSAGSGRRCAARSSGARCSASRGPARTWPRSPPRRPGPTAGGCSPVRRSGPPWRTSPTGASAWRAPTPRLPSTMASPASCSTCDPRASRSGRCGELTGQTMFNEVFMSDVFVPDDCVVGGVNNGWKAARTTLANERVSMGSGSSFGPGVEGLPDRGERRRRPPHEGPPGRASWPRPTLMR